jgi:hypothetical protein
MIELITLKPFGSEDNLLPGNNSDESLLTMTSP